MFDANRVTALNCLNCARLSEAATRSNVARHAVGVQKLTDPQSRSGGKSRRIPGIVSFSCEHRVLYREPSFKEVRDPRCTRVLRDVVRSNRFETFQSF